MPSHEPAIEKISSDTRGKLSVVAAAGLHAKDGESDWIDLGSEFVDAGMIARRWQAARSVQSGLPAYEELALGTLGRFADEMAVVRCTQDQEPMILRAGARFEAIVGAACASRPVSDLFHAFSFAIRAALDGARIRRSPHMALSKALVDGMVSTIETIAFPLSCRWPGEYFLLFVRPRESRLELAHMLINSAQQGIMALSPVERSAEADLDFYILGINVGAARYFGASPEKLQHTLLSDALSRVGLSEALALFGKASGGRPETNFELEYDLDGAPMSLQAGVAAADGILAVTLTDVRDIKARAALFRSLFDENPVPMYLRSADGGRFLNANAAALNLYGYQRDAFFGLDFADICDTQIEDLRTDAGSAEGATSLHRTSSGAKLDVIEYTKDVSVEGQPAILSTILDITAGDPDLAAMVEPMLVVRRTLREQFAVLHKRLLAIARDDALMQRLMTVPGVGAVVALGYVATVDVAARFARSKAVGAVFGLTPWQYQSGEVQRQGHVSLCGDATMRALLYEAAQAMLFRSQKWSWLKAWAMKIVQRRGAMKGIVAPARRLAVVMHRRWVDGTTFRASREGVAAQA